MGRPVPIFLNDDEYATLVAACEVLIPGDETPGARDAGVADYIDTLLGAFTFDPPRVFAGGPTSGRFGGPAGFASFSRLGPLEELAWRMRIEGSRGLSEREFNGPVRGYQEKYQEGLARLGSDFADRPPEDQRARSRPIRPFWSSSMTTPARACTGHPSTAATGTWPVGGASTSTGTSNPEDGATTRWRRRDEADDRTASPSPGRHTISRAPPCRRRPAR